MAVTQVREIRPEVTEESPTPMARRGTRLPWILLAVALLGAVAFAVLWQRAEAEQRGEQELRDTAREFVLALTNFSSESIRADVDEIRSYATGRFAEEVDTLFGEQTIESIEEARASSRSEVQELFVQSMGSERASVFAVVSEEVTNRSLDEPQPGVIRLEVEMLKASSGWKVEGVQLFQSPGEDFLPS
jgi:hypothetical protein